MNNYLKLIKASTPYANRMTRLRNRIFGEVVSDVSKPSLKVLQMFKEEPLYKRSYVVNYYPRLMETFHLMVKLRKYGLFRDEHFDFVQEMKKQRILKGKVKPMKKKGKKEDSENKESS